MVIILTNGPVLRRFRWPMLVAERRAIGPIGGPRDDRSCKPMDFDVSGGSSLKARATINAWWSVP
jgi:hypothetical protein